jgi:hypothetical protein
MAKHDSGKSIVENGLEEAPGPSERLRGVSLCEFSAVPELIATLIFGTE